jgi:hypothetical protein
VLRAPFGLELCKAGFGGMPCYPVANNTRNWLLRCAFGGFLGVCDGEAVRSDGVVNRCIAVFSAEAFPDTSGQTPMPRTSCLVAFFAFYATYPTKAHPLRLVTPPKPPDPVALSRKRGGNSRVLPLRRWDQGEPPLWPPLAEIARLAKTAVLP